MFLLSVIVIAKNTTTILLKKELSCHKTGSTYTLGLLFAVVTLNISLAYDLINGIASSQPVDSIQKEGTRGTCLLKITYTYKG